MLYRWLADAVVALHFLFLLFVVLGGLLALRWPKAVWFHIPCAIWGALIEFLGFVCPLTPLENWLRGRGGEREYAGGFIEHYIIPVLYPSGLTRGMQVLLGAAVVVLNIAVYWRVLRRHRRAHGSAPPN
jgi:hypothetical protein